MDSEIKILFVEDLPADVELAKRTLLKGGLKFQSRLVENEIDFIHEIENFAPDIIISDYNMPQFNGMRALKILLEKNYNIPFILLTGSLHEEIAVDCMKSGASDYIIKEHITRLPFAVKEALEKKKRTIEKEIIEKKLIESEYRLRRFYESGMLGIIYWNINGKITDTNDKFLEMVGYSRDELRSDKIDWINMTPPEFRYLDAISIKELKATGINRKPLEKEYLRKDGTRMPILLAGAMLDEARTNGVAFVLDISEKKTAEELLKESEERFRSLYENSTIGLYRTTPDGKIVLANPTLVNMLGYSTFEELADKDLTKEGFEPTYEREQFIDMIETNSQVKGLESAWIKNDGTVVYVSESAKAIRDSNGKTLCYDGTVEDITERKFAEEELRKSELRFKQVSESAHEWIWEVDSKGLYTYVSPVINELLGYEAEEIINKKYFYDFFDPEIKEEYKKAALEAFAGKEKFKDFINCNIHKDDRKIFLSTTGIPILDKDNNLIGYRGVDVDITERLRAEEALRDSEEKFSKAFITSPYSITITRVEDGRFIEINDAFTSITGYTREEALADSSIGLKLWANEEDRNRVVDDLRVGKIVNGNEYQFRTKSGKNITGLFSGQIIHFNNASYILSSINDITERRQMYDQLQKTNLRLYTLLSSLYAGVLTTSKEGKVEHVNQAFCNLFNLSETPADLYGLSSPDMIKKIADQYADPAATIARIQKFVAEGKPVKGEEIAMRDGQFFLVDYIPIIDKGGIESGRIWHHQNITERKREETELIKAKGLAEQSDKLKSEFLTQMSHEIRSPMNAVLSFASILREDLKEKITPELIEYFDGIDSAGHRLIRTVDLILNASELQVGSYNPTFTDIDLVAEIIRKIKSDYSKLIKDRGLKINFISNFTEAIIHGDNYSIYQIFVNLIDNAVKYTEKGSISIKIEKNQNKQEIQVIIEDTGIGMSEEFMSHMYKPFTQEDRGYSRKYEGNGLGLSLVKKYCELNGITIEVESKKGIGSKFTLTFTGTK